MPSYAFRRRVLRPIVRRFLPGTPVGGGSAVPPVAVTGPLGGDALRRARAALDAGDPDEAIAIHSRDIVGSPPLTVAVMRLLPPVRQAMRRYAAGQIADDEALESLGVGLDRYAGLDLPVLLLGGARSPARLRAGLDAPGRRPAPAGLHGHLGEAGPLGYVAGTWPGRRAYRVIRRPRPALKVVGRAAEAGQPEGLAGRYTRVPSAW
jgi:hypothetical protein